MKLTYFTSTVPNFGDELNALVWRHIVPPGFLDEDPRQLFLGIGSIIKPTYPPGAKKYIVGSGYGWYEPAPDVFDGTWETVFVRGPRTAAILNLPAEKSICDGAVLLRKIPLLVAHRPRQGTGFMPHFESLSRGDWQSVCERAGMIFVDPSAPVEQTLATIGTLGVLVTEAMHGAIVADAMRTPWIAVQPIHPEHRMKWLDWSDSLGLNLRAHRLWPSSALEMLVTLTRGRRYYDGRAARLASNAMLAPLSATLSATAALRLRAIGAAEPQLSDDRVIADVTDRAKAAVDDFVARQLEARVHPHRATRKLAG